MKKITFIGHVAVDIVNTPTHRLIPGGGVFYGADAVRAINQNVDIEVVTKISREHEHLFSDLRSRNISLCIINSSKTTTFENVYPDNNPDNRISYCHERASEWNSSDIMSVSKDCVIISCLWTPEFPECLIPSIRKLTNFLVVDVQGFTRFVTPENKIEHHDWPGKSTYFKYFDLIKVDAKEATMLTNEQDMNKALDILIQMCSDTGMIVCTHKEGIILKTKKCAYESYFGKYTIEGRTGRGDTVTAILTSLLLEGKTYQDALDLTAEFATIKMQHPGSLRKEYIV